MTLELIAVFAVGGAIVAVNIALFGWLRADLGQIRRGIAGLREGLAALEARVDLALARRPSAAIPAHRRTG